MNKDERHKEKSEVYEPTLKADTFNECNKRI